MLGCPCLPGTCPVLTAVRNDGMALEFATAWLRGDHEVVLGAVTNCGEAMQFASAELRADRRFASLAVACSGMALQYVSVALKNDRDVVLPAVKKHGQAFKFASVALQEDPDVIGAAGCGGRWHPCGRLQVLRRPRVVPRCVLERKGMKLDWVLVHRRSAMLEVRCCLALSGALKDLSCLLAQPLWLLASSCLRDRRSTWHRSF